MLQIQRAYYADGVLALLLPPRAPVGSGFLEASRPPPQWPLPFGQVSPKLHDGA